MSNDELSNFFNEMMQEGQKYAGGGNVGIVGQMKIEFGYHRYVAGHDFWEFWSPVPMPKDAKQVAAKLKAKLEAVGNQDSLNFGIKVTILKDALSAEKPYKADLQEFTPIWQKEGYELIINAAEEAGIPANDVFFGQCQMKANPFKVAQGEAGKTDKDQNGNPRFPTIRVPVKKFKDEKEARAFVNSTAAPDRPPFSELALKTFEGNIESFISEADVIQKYLTMALQGIGVDNQPLAKKPNPSQAKQYIADTWKVEPGDIDLVLQLLQESAF